MDIDSGTTCRVCLKSSASTDIFATRKRYNSTEVPCYEMMSALFSLEVSEDDALPRKICQSCWSKLTSAYKLKVLAERSHKQLLLLHTKKKMILAVGDPVGKVEVKDEIKIEYAIKEERDGVGESEDFLLGFGDTIRSRSHDAVKSEGEGEGEMHDTYVEERSAPDDDDEDDLPLVMVEGSKQQHAKSEFPDSEILEESPLPTGKKKRKKRKKTGKSGPALCPLCGKCFKNFTYADYHRRDIHLKERNYFCDYCSKGFFHRSGLTTHLNSHIKAKKYKCKDCGKGFCSTAGLSAHRMVEAGIKKYVCSICSKRFVAIGALKAHMLSHTKEKSLPCKYCGTMFGRRWHLRVHERTLHENRGGVLPPQPPSQIQQQQPV